MVSALEHINSRGGPGERAIRLVDIPLDDVSILEYQGGNTILATL